MIEKLLTIYEKDYKKLMLIPIIILILFGGLILYEKVTTGEYFQKDITLKGGTSITLYTNEIEGVNEWLTETWGSDSQLIVISDPIGGFKGYEFRVGEELSNEAVINELETLTNKELTREDYSIGLQGASIATNFFRESIIIIIISFILMAGVIFYYFKSFIPAVSITFSTIADVIVVLGVLNLLGMPLSVSGIGAILMLIGYSTDSDMLLAANILKKEQKGLMKRLKKSFKTELTMNAAAITTALIMYLLSDILIIKDIALILLIGSISDLFNTWILSAGMQRMYKEWKSK